MQTEDFLCGTVLTMKEGQIRKSVADIMGREGISKEEVEKLLSNLAILAGFENAEGMMTKLVNSKHVSNPETVKNRLQKKLNLYGGDNAWSLVDYLRKRENGN